MFKVWRNTHIDCEAIKIPVLSVWGNYKALPAQLSFIPAVYSERVSLWGSLCKWRKHWNQFPSPQLGKIYWRELTLQL